MVDTMKWVSIPIQDVINNDFRLEASCYNLDAIKAIKAIEKTPYPILALSNLIEDCYYGGRCKRKLVTKNSLDSVGFIGSSEMLSILPHPTKFMKASQVERHQYSVDIGTILLSRSGTIGNVTIVNQTLSKYYVSEHAIRIICKSDNGYIYAFLRTDIAQHLIESKIFGAVVSQIEPHHIKQLMIPYPDESIRADINRKIIESFDLRDVSNGLVAEAERLLIKELDIPPLADLKYSKFDCSLSIKNFSITSNQLDERLEASYYNPLFEAISCAVTNAGVDMIALGDKNLSIKVILPGRFKRVYVGKNMGTVFLGGKQIYELDPYNKKYLSIKKHGERIDNDLHIQENMIAVTRSGTIGRVNLIPKYMENWIYSEHVIRVVPSTNDVAGYLYIWLNSDYGRALIERYSYGAVIKEIDNKQLAQMPIPVIHDKNKIKQINDLALEANKLRTEAYYLEQEAIEDVNKLMGLDIMEE